MPRSKRTQEQIEDTKANEYDYVGDKEVASHLEEIEFAPSTLETIDGAMLRFIDEELNLSTSTNRGFKKVPVLWVTAERAYQIKHNKDLRDGEETLVLPLLTVHRSAVTKEPNFRGTVWANLYPTPGAKGGVITIARELNQKKTAEFENAMANRKYGGTTKDVAAKGKNTNQRQHKTNTGKTVYETVTIPLPVWVKVSYQINLRTEYQQRNYETSINIEVLGYLVGEGENQEKPKIVRRQNAVEFKIGRERTIVGDIPRTIKDGFYRE